MIILKNLIIFPLNQNIYAVCWSSLLLGIFIKIDFYHGLDKSSRLDPKKNKPKKEKKECV